VGKVEIFPGIPKLAAIPNFFAIHHRFNEPAENSVMDEKADAQMPVVRVGQRYPIRLARGTDRELPFTAAKFLCQSGSRFRSLLNYL